jgi:hypothetical protein
MQSILASITTFNLFDVIRTTNLQLNFDKAKMMIHPPLRKQLYTMTKVRKAQAINKVNFFATA